MISTSLLLTRERQIELWRWRKVKFAIKPGRTASIREGMKKEKTHKPTCVHL